MSLDNWSVNEAVDHLLELGVAKRILLMLAIWLALAIGAFLLFWQDDLEQARQAETEIQTSLTQLKAQSQLLLEQPATELELAELELLLPELKKTLPSERELASLLGRINEMILENTLRLAEFTPQQHQDLEVMRRVPIKLTVRGEGASIAKLPNHIASLSRQVTMKEFEMSLIPESGVWQLSGELNAFAQPVAGPAGTPLKLEAAQ
jgi:type IV pilus assembly protein PilO